MKYKILFLGPDDSPLIEWMRSQGDDVVPTSDKISVPIIHSGNFDFAVSYGYRYIVRNDVLDLLQDKVINLHISYLPHNRGADPNFWSFIDDSPKGVSVHVMDEGLDTGAILAQREVAFDMDVDTLGTSYNKLQEEIQLLFKENWKDLKEGNLAASPQVGEGSFHYLKDKKPLLYLLDKYGWDTKVRDLLNVSY